MSNSIKIGFVVEGTADFIILSQVVGTILGEPNYVSIPIQPHLTNDFRVAQDSQAGSWTGVYYWCREVSSDSAGELAVNPLLSFCDLVVVQIDADVACKTYTSAHILDPPPRAVLPCQKPCPPSENSTTALRAVVLKWLNEDKLPDKVVFCTPSKATDLWVAIGLFYNRRDVGGLREVECRDDPKSLLRGKPAPRKLIDGNQPDLAKYLEFAPEVAQNWDIVRRRCTEAMRFDSEFRAAMEPILARIDAQ